jgi:aspartate aminotransferase
MTRSAANPWAQLVPARTKPSATVALNDTVARLVAEGRSVVNLSSGDPDFATPTHVVEAAITSLRAGRTHYAPSRGVPALLDAIAASRLKRTGVAVDPGREIVVTPSAKYAIAVAVEALVGIGEKVMILSPSWVSYAAMATIAGAKPYPVALDPGTGFRVTRELLECGHQPGTRLLMINSPNNPTGRVLDDDELAALADFAQENDLLVLADEIYEDVIYGDPQRSLASLPGMAERTLVVSGFSKAFAMTGWRLGYAIGAAPLISRILSVHQHTAACVATFVQDAGVAALEAPSDSIDEMVSVYASRVERALAALSEVPELSAPRPDGAFYLFVNVSGTPTPSSIEFASWALERAGVTVVPGHEFGPGGERHVRLSLTTPSDVFCNGIDLIRAALSAGPDRKELA